MFINEKRTKCNIDIVNGEAPISTFDLIFNISFPSKLKIDSYVKRHHCSVQEQAECHCYHREQDRYCLTIPVSNRYENKRCQGIVDYYEGCRLVAMD